MRVPRLRLSISLWGHLLEIRQAGSTSEWRDLGKFSFGWATIKSWQYAGSVAVNQSSGCKIQVSLIKKVGWLVCWWWRKTVTLRCTHSLQCIITLSQGQACFIPLFGHNVCGMRLFWCQPLCQGALSLIQTGAHYTLKNVLKFFWGFVEEKKLTEEDWD